MNVFEYYNCIIQPGHLAYSHEPSLIFTVCGNGLVVTIRDKVNGIGGIAHCVYPKARMGETPTHYHADTALRSLLKILGRTKDTSHRFEAQIIGGGHFKGVHQGRAEKTNRAIKRFLNKRKIAIVSEDVGGVLGRKVLFNSATGETFIMKTNKIRRTDWLPELIEKHGLKRIAFERSTFE